MKVPNGLRRIAVSYRNTAKLAFIVLVVIAFATSPLLVHANSNTGTPMMMVTAANACISSQYFTGNVLVVWGNFSINGFAINQAYIKGSVTVTYQDGTSSPQNVSWTFTGNYYYGTHGTNGNSTNGSCPAYNGLVVNGKVSSGTPSPVATNMSNYSFLTKQTAPYLPTKSETHILSITIMLQAYSNSQYTNLYTSSGLVTLAGPSQGSISNPTFQFIIELPMFSDPQLGAYFNCGGALDCSLPLSYYYNYIMIIAIIITVIAALVSFSTNQNGGGQKAHSWILDALMTVILIVAFPWIYNEVAGLLNYLNAALIAGPAAPDAWASANTNINIVWNAAKFSGIGGLWGVISDSLFTIASWFIGLFVYIGVYVLGIIRIFIMAVMIVAFPLSLALRNIKFTEKLAGMIEDTLFGVMIASIMSAVILGIASQILAPGNSAAYNNSMLGGAPKDFIAAIALLSALFMPTIFAPLTSTLFQTGMQMAMAAGSMASMVALGGATGTISGLSSVGSMNANNISGLAAATGKSGTELAGMSTLGRASLGLRSGYGWGTMTAPFQNMGVEIGAGALGAVGATQGAKAIRSYHKRGDQIAAGHEQYAQGIHSKSVMGQLTPMIEPVGTVMAGIAAGKEFNPVQTVAMSNALGETYIKVNPMKSGTSKPTGADMKTAVDLKNWYEKKFTSQGFVNEMATHGGVTQSELDANPQLNSQLLAQGSAIRKPLENIDPTRSYNELRKMANANNFTRYMIYRFNAAKQGNAAAVPIKPGDYLT